MARRPLIYRSAPAPPGRRGYEALVRLCGEHLIVGLSKPPRRLAHHGRDFALPHPVLAQDFFQVARRLGRVRQCEPLPIVIPVIVEPMLDDSDAGAALEQCQIRS